jgi:hypothetical protein
MYKRIAITPPNELTEGECFYSAHTVKLFVCLTIFDEANRLYK